MMLRLPPNSRVHDDAEATAHAAAAHLLDIAASAVSHRIAICLCGGATPRRLYELLASRDYAERVPWSRIHWFFGDDRVVPWDAPMSNVRMVREVLGHGVRIPECHFHRIPSDEGPENGARAYELALRDYYGAETLDPKRPLFDLVLLGLGRDGHTASLFPGMPALAEREAWVVAVPEAGMEPFIPRITLTFPTLASSRSVLFLVTGAEKRNPLKRLSQGDDLPAAQIASVGTLTWFIDRQAAEE